MLSDGNEISLAVVLEIRDRESLLNRPEAEEGKEGAECQLGGKNGSVQASIDK